MKTKTILVVGYAQQTQTAHQIETLKRLGAEVITLDPYGDAGRYASLIWQDQRILWGEQTIAPSQLGGILVCAQAPETPAEAAFTQAEEGKLSWEAWFQQFGLQRDRSDTLLGLLLSFEQLGIPMFNPPGQSLLSRRKPYQLHALKQIGCQLPPTLITNNPEAAAQFIREHGECIVKPTAGGSLTLSANQLLENNQLHHLIDAPAIFQKRILGRDIRVTVVNGQIVSSATIDVPREVLDFRGYTPYQEGRIHYWDTTLPSHVAVQCRRAVSILGLKFAGIDIRVTDQDEYYLIECNSSPIYLDVERKLHHPITDSLCHALVTAS